MRGIRYKLIRIASFLPLKLLLWIDHKNIWSRDEAGFSSWTDAHYSKYVRNDTDTSSYSDDVTRVRTFSRSDTE